jgi:hypothetical protein
LYSKIRFGGEHGSQQEKNADVTHSQNSDEDKVKLEWSSTPVEARLTMSAFELFHLRQFCRSMHDAAIDILDRPAKAHSKMSPRASSEFPTVHRGQRGRE